MTASRSKNAWPGFDGSSPYTNLVFLSIFDSHSAKSVESTIHLHSIPLSKALRMEKSWNVPPYTWQVETKFIFDPERPGAIRVVHTGRQRVRQRYRAAARARRKLVEAELRRYGAELLWLRTDRSPLHALGRFFRERAARRAAA